jgi:hypothetical protein
MDAIEKYEIVANGITKYTQNFAPEESFLTSCTQVETAKKCDPFARVRHKDIFNKKFESGLGVYIDPNAPNLNTPGALTYDAKFKLKIDLRRFLPLSNIKYLPAFAGKIELRLLFSTAGLVWCPLNPCRLTSAPPGFYQGQIKPVTAEFQPIGQPCMVTESQMVTNVGPSDGTNPRFVMFKTTTGSRTLSVDPTSLLIDKLDSCIYCFGIADQL